MEMEEHAEEYETSLKRSAGKPAGLSGTGNKNIAGINTYCGIGGSGFGHNAGTDSQNLVFLADGKPILIVACGDKKIDTKKWGRAIEAKKIKMADAETVMQITGLRPEEYVRLPCVSRFQFIWIIV